MGQKATSGDSRMSCHSMRKHLWGVHPDTAASMQPTTHRGPGAALEDRNTEVRLLDTCLGGAYRTLTVRAVSVAPSTQLRMLRQDAESYFQMALLRCHVTSWCKRVQAWCLVPPLSGGRALPHQHWVGDILRVSFAAAPAVTCEDTVALEPAGSCCSQR